jgi:hypothetical protein
LKPLTPSIYRPYLHLRRRRVPLRPLRHHHLLLRALPSGEYRRVTSDQKILTRSILDVVSSCSNSTLVPFGQCSDDGRTTEDVDQRYNPQ